MATLRDAPRKSGRPKVQEPRTSLSTWLAVSDYDLLVKRANAREKKLSAHVRDILRRDLSGRK